MRVLIANLDTTSTLQTRLEAEGHDVACEPTIEGAYFRVATERFDAVLLDLSHHRREAVDVLALISRGGSAPVLCISSHGDVADRVRCLDGGADDYLVKPYATPELLARLRSLVRRHRATASRQLVVGTLCMDLVRREVTIAGRPVVLTAREFELLEHLIRAGGCIVSREALVQQVWRERGRKSLIHNVIDVHIARLRRKLRTSPPQLQISTVRGVGFILRDGTEVSSSWRD